MVTGKYFFTPIASEDFSSTPPPAGFAFTITDFVCAIVKYANRLFILNARGVLIPFVHKFRISSN